MLSCSVVSDSLQPHGLCDCGLPGSSVHEDSPGKNTGMGCHALLQGIFPTHGSNPGLPHCRRILYQLSHKGSPASPWVQVISPEGWAWRDMVSGEDGWDFLQVWLGHRDWIKEKRREQIVSQAARMGPRMWVKAGKCNWAGAHVPWLAQDCVPSGLKSCVWAHRGSWGPRFEIVNSQWTVCFNWMDCIVLKYKLYPKKSSIFLNVTPFYIF